MPLVPGELPMDREDVRAIMGGLADILFEVRLTNEYLLGDDDGEEEEADS